MTVFYVLKTKFLQFYRQIFKRSFRNYERLPDTMVASDSGPTFLSLPYEVREMIYYHTLDDLPSIFNTYVQNPPLHNLLLSNRQIYEEYAKIYYGSQIFHLHVRRTAANDDKRPETSGLAKWHLRSPITMGYLREVMLHFEISFRSDVSPKDHHQPTNLQWLADGLAAMAPNIEVIHIVLFCGRDCFQTVQTQQPCQAETQPRVDDKEVMSQVVDIIPWIQECCKPARLPALMRLVLHIDKKYGNSEITYFMDKMSDYCWIKSFARSFVNCDVNGWHGNGPCYSEHVFKVTDKRERPWQREFEAQEAERKAKRYNSGDLSDPLENLNLKWLFDNSEPGTGDTSVLVIKDAVDPVSEVAPS